jgi:integrase
MRRPVEPAPSVACDFSGSLVLVRRLIHRTHFGRSHVIDILKDRITTYIARRQEAGAAAATINRELAALKRAFSLAEEAGRVAERPRFSLLQEDNARAGFFEPEQYSAVLDALPGYLRPVVQTAYVTGWRVPSEILRRQRHHLDLDNGWLRLDPGENKLKTVKVVTCR